MRLWLLIEVSAAFAAVSWCSTLAPAAFRSIGDGLAVLSTYLSNHHVVFLIGNAIVVFLFMLGSRTGNSASAAADGYVDYGEAVRHGEGVAAASGGGEFRESDYVKCGEAAARAPPQHGEELAPPSEIGCRGEEKIVAVGGEDTAANSNVAEAIEKAAKQIRRFQRTESETLRSEIAVRQRKQLRRSVTESFRHTVEMENLSNEEFRRKVDAFIEEHWIKRSVKFEQ